MRIKITVSGPDGIAHVIDLEQESEGFWLEFLTEMQNAGHGADTICRTIAERIKATVQPVLTAGPVDNAAEAGTATYRALAVEVINLAFEDARGTVAEYGRIIEKFMNECQDHADVLREKIVTAIMTGELKPERPVFDEMVGALTQPAVQPTNDNSADAQSAEA